MRRPATGLGLLLCLCAAAAGRAEEGDPAYGEYLSGECVTCHRQDAHDGGIPPIAGWEPAAFIAVLKSYRAKERDNQVMQTIAAGLGDEEIAALAAYFATLARR